MKKSKKMTLSPSKSNKKTANREFAVITYMFLGIFLLMMGYFVYFQVFRSEDVINSPYNRRQESFAQHVVRGSILASDGTVLAETILDETGNEIRYYPYGEMFAHVVGYNVNGKAGIESFANFNLLRSHSFFLEQIINGVQDEKNQGDTVVTTLDFELQEIAYEALEDEKGAVIVMEPSTGKILAMVSKPDFNPNTISEDWDEIISDDENSRLLNRTTQGLYPPGSTFKILTTLEYIRENPKYVEYLYHCEGSIRLNDFIIHCAKNTAHGEEDLMMAFANSCNAAYASIGAELDLSEFAELCDSLLFHQNLPTSYPFKQSSFSLNENSSKDLVMQTAIGQGKTLITPMHLTLITSSIVNDGMLMKPYVIDYTENDNGATVKKYKPIQYAQILNASECGVLQEFLEKVVEEGTATQLQNENYQAGGKTGSAEYSNNKDEAHAWFTGYAQNEECGEIVVTIIVEGGASGRSKAVPIAKQLFDAYFN